MINWGDGATTPGTIVQTGASPNGSTFQVNGSHVYAEEGIFQTQVTVTDTGGSATVATGNAVIADAPLTAAGLTLGVAPSPLIYNYPAFTGNVATFTDADPNGTVTDYTASINWGDGVITAGTVSANPSVTGQFLVSGTHLYAQAAAPTRRRSRSKTWAARPQRLRRRSPLPTRRSPPAPPL